jgi:hypothetical protein
MFNLSNNLQSITNKNSSILSTSEENTNSSHVNQTNNVGISNILNNHQQLNNNGVNARSTQHYNVSAQRFIGNQNPIINNNNNNGFSVLYFPPKTHSNSLINNADIISKKWRHKTFQGNRIDKKLFGTLIKNKDNQIVYIYEGMVNKSYKPHGLGVLKLVNKGVYNGQFIKGLFHGHGKQTIGQYERSGTWESGKFIRGEIKRSKGDTEDFIYSGSIKNNQANGFGELTNSIGKYRGYFQDFKYHGNGRLTLKDREFAGEWDNHTLIEGTCTYQSDDDGTMTYSGFFKDFLFNGNGTLYSSSKKKYIGNFMDNKFHGQGILNIGNFTYDGDWENNDLNFGTVQLDDGDFNELYSYKGSLKNLQFDGMGTITYPNGLKFKGSFSKGLLNGSGEWVLNHNLKCSVRYKENRLTYCRWFKNGQNCPIPINLEEIIPVHFLTPKDNEIPF